MWCFIESTTALVFLGFVMLSHADNDVSLKASCQTYDDCRLACGSGSIKYKCHKQGFCSCIGQYMPANRCEELDSKDVKCQKYCSFFNEVESRRCETKNGRICSCFVYSEEK